MSCFPCFQKEEEEGTNKEGVPIAQPKDFTPPPPQEVNKNAVKDSSGNAKNASANENHESAKSYTFRELASATKNFRQECLLGEGGFGRVFKGTISQSGQTVAVRQLDRNGVQASTEFANEVSRLSLLQHPNLVKIIGYCADGEQRILVYEYMPSGSLKNHLFDLPAGKKPLDWTSRMKIALGIAEGLEFLHEKVNPPIIYRDLKSSNILLDEVNNPRLSEYGLAKLVQTSNGNKMHVTPRVMAGYGYGAPEYETHGELTLKSDVYSFGVILLELITGRRAMDTSQPTDEQNLVSWAQPIFRDPSKFPDMADPLLRKQFPVTSLNQAVGVAAMCLQEEPTARPLISDISAALSFLAMAPPEAPIPARLVPILSSRVSTSEYSSFKEDENVPDQKHTQKDDKKNDSSDSSDDEEDRKIHHSETKDDDKSSSDYDYGDDNSNTDTSDDDKPKMLGSSSKRKSKKKSLSKKSSSKRRNSRSSSSSSLSSRSGDYSVGFSLRCDSAFLDRSDSSVSRHDIFEHDHGYGDHHKHNSSSSDDESGGESDRSNSGKFHERMHSRKSDGSDDEEEEYED
ncbi:hypothetical protein CASFOL_006469 [Castilleja foliolosa]|uniref:Protein kinase domain-containing protein n=1 Tax=Castilleja foliolosa TaxID=1961234 RepID=A0ABD3EAE7_9LAMI